jgi:hypothetical protein
MMIHFIGRGHIDNPGLLVHAKVSVCVDCGFSRFTPTETELRILANRVAVPASQLSSPLAVGACVSEIRTPQSAGD